MRDFDEVAAEIVAAVLRDLRRRRGLRQEFDQIENVAPDILRLRDDLEYEGDLVDDLRGVVLGVLDVVVAPERPSAGEAPAPVDGLLRILMRALADARTTKHPHDPEVQDYWREEIRKALDVGEAPAGLPIVGHESKLMENLAGLASAAIHKRHEVTDLRSIRRGFTFDVRVLYEDDRPTGHLARVTVELDRYEATALRGPVGGEAGQERQPLSEFEQRRREEADAARDEGRRP